ncbi:hypothetical protein N7454_011261 [Penicillium verhagenii]|nr:hypothetical protein N7454_011261 [Penicillium verhagenii]
MATTTEFGEEASGLVNTLQGHVDAIRGLIQCGICIRPLYEPFTLACGHTFCYSCLSSWFAGGKSKRTCPDCRAPVKTQPAPAYLVRAVVQMYTSRAELLGIEETTAEHSKNHKEEIEKLEKDKANTDPQSGGLFGGLFTPKPAQPKPVIDIDDNIVRCPHCAWELEDGQSCGGCGYVYRPDPEGTDYSGSDFSDSDDYDSILDGDDDDDDEEDEDEEAGPQTSLSRTLNAPYHTFNRSVFGSLLPDLHPHPFYFPGVRQTTHGQPWNYSHSNPVYEDEADDGEMDRDHEGEEEEEDYYEESFIDDEEHTQREREESESDHSTVIGASRARNHDSSRGPPIVQYPRVFGPSSTAEPEGYDWDSEDEARLARFREPVIDVDLSESGSEDPGPRGHDQVLSSISNGSSQATDDSESSPIITSRRYHPTSVIPASSDDEIDDDDSSSPPRTRIRTTGSNSHNAIAIDDSDEDEELPVGPVRRTTQRRQARFSPY